MPDAQYFYLGKPEGDAEAIDAALLSGSQWQAGMEALFERQRGADRRARAVRVIALSGVIFLATAVVDRLDSAAVLAMALPWRLAVLGLCLACAACLRKSPPAAQVPRAELALHIVPEIAMMMTTEVIAQFGGRWADRYMMGAAFGVAAYVATAPITLLTARWLCALAILAYPVVPALLPYAVPLRSNWDLPVFAVGVMGTALLVANRTEHARRAGFLLRRRHEISAAELNAMNSELLRLSRTDALTGLHNRRAFTQALHAQWQDRRQSLGLAIFDVDWFKAFNDSAGHAAGDAALQAVAGAAERAVRRGVDLLARIGGEEFAVLMPGIAQDQAIALAERLRAEVAALRLPHPGRPGGILSISVGVACCGQADRMRHTADEFMIDADRALYAAKGQGRDCVALARKEAVLF